MVAVGGSELGAPGCDNGFRDLVERDASAEDLSEGRLATGGLRLATDARDHSLRPAEQDGPVLQEGAPLSHLRRADQLATGDEHLAAGGEREA